MKTIFGLLLVALAGLSCSWNPTRDNPADPASPFYRDPPPRNHLPQVQSVAVTTDCRQIGELSSFCAFTLAAQLTDPDNNLLHDSVYALIERHQPELHWDTLGSMQYDPLLQQFLIRRGQDEVPERSLDLLIGLRLRVSVRDDSGAIGIDETNTTFPAPRKGWPVAVSPLGNVYSQDTVYSLTPRISWKLWGDINDGHSYGISVDLYGILPVWDTSGVAAADTFLFVTDSLLNNLLNIDAFYSWSLVVTDWRGNHITGMPQFFKCQAPISAPAVPPLPPFVKRES